MKYPLVKGKNQCYPKRFKCPVCGEAPVWEPHTFVTIDGGAMLMNRSERSGGPSDDMDGFLTLGWHGAHDKGKGEYRETGGGVPIAASVRGGQFSIAVCSTNCLRQLFSQLVDELEHRMHTAVPLE